ncbi:MAG: BON domain-containing protein [Rhodothermales bacterium]
MESRVLQRLARGIRRDSSVLKHRSRRDAAIARRLQVTIDQDLEMARVHGLHVFVQNSTVTLYGTVRHELDRELIVTVARTVEGVREVVDRLEIVGSEREG